MDREFQAGWLIGRRLVVCDGGFLFIGGDGCEREGEKKESGEAERKRWHGFFMTQERGKRYRMDEVFR